MDMLSPSLQPLAYVFWHWPRPDAAVTAYEARLLSFHASLAAGPPEGFLRSAAFAVSGAPWLPAHRDGYEDWYIVRDWASVGSLNQEAIAPAHADAHDQIAHQAEGGTAGLYAVRGGNDVPGQAEATWFAKPPGWSYDDLYAVLDKCVGDGISLWQRQLTLGPAPEFCLRGTYTPALPLTLRGDQISYRPVG
jgi:hypothetical protein